MALTILCAQFTGTESTFRDASKIATQDPAKRTELSNLLADELENADKMIAIVLEQMDSQLKLLGLEKTPDAATQEVSRRLLEALQRPPAGGQGPSPQPNRDPARPE
jgi:hypothetical protein